MKTAKKPKTINDLIKSLGVPRETQALIASIPIRKSAPIRFGTRITIRYTATP